MKKIVCALVVLALAGPASADVIITADANDADATITISYELTGGDTVRCFGLDIQLDNEETITAVECLSSDYYLNPQKFTYDGINPDFGDIPCLCDYESGLLGNEPNGITIAVCSLYAEEDPDHNEAPAASNGLVKLTLSGSACITITENGTLGGVLDEDNVDIDPVLPGEYECCVEVGCACPGDYNLDSFVAFSDASDLVDALIACGWFCMPGQPCWEDCGDYNEDGYMSFSDVSDLVDDLSGWFWFKDCSGW